MLADASGRTVLRERGTVEGTARGAWMSAAVTLGLVEDFEQAFEMASAASEYDPYVPDPDAYEQYQQMRSHVRKLYDGIEAVR